MTIARIDKVITHKYEDNKQTITYVHFTDDKGKKGIIVGSPDGTHIQQLIARYIRES